MTINKLVQLLINPKLLYIKISRRIGYKYQYVKMRFNVRFDLDLGDIPLNYQLEQSSHLIAKPGNPFIFDQPNSFDSIGRRQDLENVLQHKFKVLSKEYFCVNNKNPTNLEEIKDIASQMPTDIVHKYAPIDWHCDYKSGYRWDDQSLYLDVPLSPIAGVDIKVPREMSRFQHIGEMGFGDKEVGANEFFLQLIDWITANPVRRGVNWACTMDVAIRAVNWVWGIRIFENEISKYPKIEAAISKSLIEHGRHIYSNLEYYEECTGNHYLSNVAGLIYISARIPDYKDSDEWLLFGIQELISEMNRQVYSDGFSHEASTNYHRLVTEIFLSTSALVERIPRQRRKAVEKVNIVKSKIKPRLKSVEKNKINLIFAGPVLPPAFYKKLQLMVEVTNALTKPNGLVPQIGDNDSARLHKLVPDQNKNISDHSHVLALGGVLFNDPILRQDGFQSSFEANLIAGDFVNKDFNLSSRFSKKERFFDDAGIAIQSNQNAWLCVTCGSNGQNQRGGHGHNDKNSFELNVAGQDYIVDGGCPFYTSSPKMRNKYRSSFAHSTLVVSGKEQDEWQRGIAGLFVLDQTCNPKLKMDDTGKIEGVHDGYGYKHTRTFSLSLCKLEIHDYCAVGGEKFLLFNLDPEVSVEDISIESGEVTAVLGNKNERKIRLFITGVKEPELIDGFFGEGFGRPLANKMLRVRVLSSSAKTVFSW